MDREGKKSQTGAEKAITSIQMESRRRNRKERNFFRKIKLIKTKGRLHQFEPAEMLSWSYTTSKITTLVQMFSSGLSSNLSEK